MAQIVELAQQPVVLLHPRSTVLVPKVASHFGDWVRGQVMLSRQRADLAKSASIEVGRASGCRC